jgi:hypothetical protein
MAQPLNPTDLLQATLEAQQWNQVLALVGEGPYRIVEPIIRALQEQLHAQAKPDNVFPMEAGK